MNKERQTEINALILSAVKEYNQTAPEPTEVRRLRYCNAVVKSSHKYHTLYSYGTPVAFIDRETDTLYDILRHVYGYTATSAQHITKFAKDYGDSKYGASNRLVYYPVK